MIIKDLTLKSTTYERLSGIEKYVYPVILSNFFPPVNYYDFSKIGVIDYSCADEIVAKLVSRLLGGEYGDKYIILSGLNENQKENIEVALERKGLAIMAKTKGNKKILIGNINNYLKQTLDFILEKDKITAKELSVVMKLKANTSGTRLLNLHKK